MPLLLDIGHLSERETDSALEYIYFHKAIGGDDSDGLWDAHPSPFVRRLIELFTQRGLMRLDGFRNELIAWMAGQRHVAGDRPPRPEGSMHRWTPDELKLVKLYLETLPPAEFTLDDHMMVVDYLTQRYLPADAMRTESEWLATRSVLMGRVQANMEKMTADQADKVIGHLPLNVAGAQQQFRIGRTQLAVLNYASARAVDRVQKISDETRYQMRALIRKHTEAQVLNDSTATAGYLQGKLLDKFGALNRDWRRIAVTEAGEAANQGYVSSKTPGSHVKRIEQYRGACPFCRRIDGVVMEVVDTASQPKNFDTQVWPGKDNTERSASPRKRVGGILVERGPEELWVIPAGVAHPHCRGRWTDVIEDRPGDDKEFGDWLRETLRSKA